MKTEYEKLYFDVHDIKRPKKSSYKTQKKNDTKRIRYLLAHCRILTRTGEEIKSRPEIDILIELEKRKG